MHPAQGCHLDPLEPALIRSLIVNPPKLSHPEIREWCIRRLASTLDMPAHRIDPQAKFARLGMDSAMSIAFLVDLEEWLGIELPSDTVFEYPSVEELASHLAARSATAIKRRVD